MGLETNQRKELGEWRRRAYGYALRQIRLSRKMTQEHVADRLNWPRTKLLAIEKGTQAVTVDQLGQLADFFDVAITHFFPLDLYRELQTAMEFKPAEQVRRKIAARRAQR